MVSVRRSSALSSRPYFVRMVGRLACAGLYLALWMACQGAPVAEKPAGDLEACKTEEAQTQHQAAARLLASGLAEPALNDLTRLARANPVCARLNVQENRALNLLPEEVRTERELALGVYYGERSELEAAKGAKADPAVHANLLFAWALH